MASISTAENLLISGTGPAMAAVFTNPLDVARVNMQINGEGGGQRAYRNTGDCIAQIWRQGRWPAVQRGLKTAMCREFVQNVPRLGLYAPLMQAWRAADGTLSDGTAWLPPTWYQAGLPNSCQTKMVVHNATDISIWS